MASFSKTKLLALGILALFLALLLACGESTTPTATPTPVPTATPDIGAAIQQAVQQAMAAVPTPAPGLSAEDIPSIEDIAGLVQAAVAAAAPAGTTPEQIQSMVRAAVQAAAQPGVTRAQLEGVVQAAVDSAVSEAVARITPVATPVSTPAMTAAPSPTTTPVAMAEPTGVLDVGMSELGPPVFFLQQQHFRDTKYNHITTHETLFAADSSALVIPRLAKELTIDSSGLVYTFRLQEGVKWHQGLGDWGEFNADDLLFTLESVVEEGSVHTLAGNIRRLFACDGCELTKLNDLTVQLRTPRPTFEIPWFNMAPGTGMDIHSKKHFDAVGKEGAIRQSVGTGPWEIVEARSGEFKRVKAVPNHWRKTPEWAEMTWWEIVEESTRVANFLAGLLDTGAFSGDSIQAIKGEDLANVEFMRVPGAIVQVINLHGLQYNTDAPAHMPGPGGEAPRVPLGDNAYDCTLPFVACDRDLDSAEWDKARKVRLAMAISIDRQKLINNNASGEGQPAYIFPWAPGARMAQFGLDQLRWDYDPGRARQLLAEAGYPDGFDIDMPLEPRPSPGAPENAESVATMWLEVGIRGQIQPLSSATFRPMRLGRTAKGAQSYNNPPASPEPLRIYNSFWTSFSAFNQGFEHPWYDARVTEAQGLLDDDARWAKQAEIARWMFDNVMNIPLYYENAIWPLGPELGSWSFMGGDASWLSNWEYAPHRG